MKKCYGFFGKIFGHKFKSLIINYEFNKSFGTASGRGNHFVDLVDKLADKKYKIICVRCGETSDGMGETDKI